jgi:aspartate-semialdehyde dehydrogenase
LAGAYRVAILGATGAVGTELLELLASRNFPLAELRLLASPRSAGTTVEFRGEKLTVAAVDDRAFDGIDILLASAGGSTSRALAPQAAAAGALVIDNSSAFRMQADVPLVVPEVNPEAIATHRGIIANPNCTTILMCVAVYPLHRIRPIRRIIAATYQSASGAGARAMEEVRQQAIAILNDRTPPTESFPYPLAFNLFPHNTPINADGYCEEEMKMVNETRKIFNAPEIRVSATCIRVPVLRAHSEALNLEFDTPFPVADAWEKNYFPMPIDASGKDDVLVGRIRQDLSHANGLELWLCGDQIRKGAALNAVQIAEEAIARNCLKQ